MLTISKALSAGQAQSYHAKEFTAKEQSYWAQGNTVQGGWQGRLAEQYGLTGAVSAEDFAKLSQGQHPQTEDQLVRHRTAYEYEDDRGKAVKAMEHRAGWDATFSAPKSVSLTALVGGDDRVREANRESVRVALDQLEHYTQARIGGNHPAETTGKFIAAKFEHDTARPVDGYAAPQLHTHAVIFNVTEREDGQSRALQERALFQSQQFATAVYQSELTYRLTRMGYELEPGRSRAPEIKGYTQEYLDASSPRSQQIREYLESTGRNSKEAAEIAAHSTRDRKEILTPQEVLAAHRQLAADFGNQADAVVQAARERALHLDAPSNGARQAQEAVTFARDKNFEREAVVDERLLMRDALRRGMGEVPYALVRGNLESRHAAGEFSTIDGIPHQTGRQLTTAQAIAAENDIVRQMRSGQNQVESILSSRDAISLTERHAHLNRGQQEVVKEVLTSHDRVQGIQGVAGAGKTTALEVVRAGADLAGYRVEGFAPTSRAAKQLEEAGIQSGTLQGFLAKGQQAQETPEKRLYFVDESSLAGTNQMRDFLNRLGSRDRVILIGDTRQHQAVEAGRPFQQLQEAGMSTAKLDQIVRQKDPELKTAVEQLAAGNVAGGIAALISQGRVQEIGDSRERVQAIAKDYAKHPENTLIVSPDNASRRDLNQAVRQELQTKGVVETVDHALRVLIPRQDLTGADRQWAERYNPDDILRYSRGSTALDIEGGSYARVISTNPKENLVTVEKDSGEQATYNPKRLAGVSVYREIEREFAVGDRIQFTAPEKELGVSNRELGTIKQIADGLISVSLDSGKAVDFDPSTSRHFDHGYAVTSHSSQGLTADRVLVNIDTASHPDLINSRFAYVSVSRARFDAEIYTNDASSLTKNLSSDISKSSAIEFTHVNVPSQGLSM
jgi:conjugative relaxase-like TrwC/TraI family protein